MLGQEAGDFYDVSGHSWYYTDFSDGLIQLANAVAVGTSLRWLVAGTNAANSIVAFAAGGGQTITTTTGANDQGLICPHTTTGQFGWASYTALSNSSPVFDLTLKTGSSIANTLIFGGWKKTNTTVQATDDDQAYICYDPTVSSKWTFNVSRGGTDSTYYFNNLADVAASTLYRLIVALDANLTPNAWVGVGNGSTPGLGNPVQCLPGNFAAATASIALLPFCGIQTQTTAAKAMTIKSLRLGRAFA